MKLITGWAEVVEAPHDWQIEAILQKMPGGENSFVILEKDTSRFIQAHGSSESGFLLEYWENGQGVYCHPDPTLEMVIQAFRFFVKNEGRQPELATWQEIAKKRDQVNQESTTAPGQSVQKTRQPRSTTKGLRLVAFAILSLVACCLIGGPAGLIFILPAIVPGMFLFMDLDRRRKNFSLPATPFLILANVVVQSVFIGLLVFWAVYLPDDWYLLVSNLSFLGIMGTLSFL